MGRALSGSLRAGWCKPGCALCIHHMALPMDISSGDRPWSLFTGLLLCLAGRGHHTRAFQASPCTRFFPFCFKVRVCPPCSPPGLRAMGRGTLCTSFWGYVIVLLCLPNKMGPLGAAQTKSGSKLREEFCLPSVLAAVFSLAQLQGQASMLGTRTHFKLQCLSPCWALSGHARGVARSVHVAPVTSLVTPTLGNSDVTRGFPWPAVTSLIMLVLPSSGVTKPFPWPIVLSVVTSALQTSAITRGSIPADCDLPGDVGCVSLWCHKGLHRVYVTSLVMWLCEALAS